MSVSSGWGDMMGRNRILGLSVVVTGLLALMTFSAIGANRPEPWMKDFAQAKALAKQSGRPLLVHFYATWCGPCRQMEKDVLHTNTVHSVLSQHFIAVMVDSDKHPELVEQFNIQSLPSDVVLSPDGVMVAKSERSRDKNGYLAQLQQFIDQTGAKPNANGIPQPQELIAGKEPAGKAFVDNQPIKQEVLPQKIVVPDPEQKPVVEQKLLVGLGRYSPVSLFNNRIWRKGKPDFALVYQGVVYLMFDAEEYRAFQADPAKYAPRLLGCDPVVLWKSDRAIPGSTEFGAYFDGELYLFSNAENRDQFKESPNRYSRPQHVLRIDEIDGPRWR